MNQSVIHNNETNSNNGFLIERNSCLKVVILHIGTEVHLTNGPKPGVLPEYFFNLLS